MNAFLFDFERLEVYQKSLDFIDDIFRLYKSWRPDYKITIGSNLVRAALSVANNLAEGNGKQSKKEKRRYFGTALDSARECISVFNVLKRQGILDEEKYGVMRTDGRVITNMIWGLIEGNGDSQFSVLRSQFSERKRQ